MIVSLNNVYKLIKENGYKSAKMYQGETTQGRAFEIIKKDTPEELIKRLQELENVVSGKFTLLLGYNREGEQNKNMAEVKTEFYETVVFASPSLNAQTDDYVSASTLNKKVDELVQQKLQDLERQKEVEELRAKVAEMETLGGKVNYLLTGFVTKFIEAKLTPTTMQGFENNGVDQEATNTKNLTQLENDLSIIVKYFGEDNINKFATKIQNGQANAVKPIIINFLNN